MPKRVRAIQHGRRFAAQPSHRVAAHEQVADERFSAGDEFVGEDIPGSGLDTPITQECGKLRRPLRPNTQVVVEENRLPVEQKALARHRGVIQQFVHEPNETLAKAFGRMVPLAIPVRVRNDVEISERRGHAAECGPTARVAQAGLITSPRHSRESGNRCSRVQWIPAFAGMTTKFSTAVAKPPASGCALSCATRGGSLSRAAPRCPSHRSRQMTFCPVTRR